MKAVRAQAIAVAKSIGVTMEAEMAVDIILAMVEKVIEAKALAELEAIRAKARDRKARSRDKSVTGHGTEDVTAAVTVTDETQQKPEKSQASGEKALVVAAAKGGLGGSLSLFSESDSGSDSDLLPKTSEDRRVDERRGQRRPNLHDQVTRLWCEVYEDTRGSPYVPNAQDRSHLGRMLNDAGTVGWTTERLAQELPGAFRRYLLDPSKWLNEEKGHTLGHFCSSNGLSRYLAANRTAGYGRKDIEEAQLIQRMVKDGSV